MDPESNLAEQKRLIQRILDTDDVDADDARRLAELSDALDGWMCGGGFLPRAWAAKRSSAPVTTQR